MILTTWTSLAFMCLLAGSWTYAIPVFNVAQEQGSQPNSFFYHIEDGYHYTENNEAGGRIYYKCIVYERLGCHGRAILDAVEGFVHSNEHNHEPDLDYPAERCCINRILARCEALEYLPFQRIIEEEGARFNEEVRSRISIARMRTPMRNARMRNFPNQPQTLRDLSNILLNPQHRVLTMTDDGLSNIYAGSVTDVLDGHHVVFISDRMLNQMRLFNVLHSDGTFRTVPVGRHFAAQVFCIVGVWLHHIIPLGWVLMETVHEEAYTAVLEFLSELLGPNIELNRVITDFETGLQNAWANVFNVHVQGCLWHLARAYMRQVASLNLIRQMRRIPDVRQIIRLTLALPLLPENLIVRGFRVLMDYVRGEGNYIFGLLRDYLSYIHTNWIARPWRRRRMCVFRSQQRTNNACESHNRLLRNTVGIHPNIYRFLRGLVTLEQRSHNTCYALDRHRRVMRGRRATSVVNDQQIEMATNDLLQPAHPLDRHILRFLRTVSHHLDGIVDEILQDLPQ